MFLDTEKRRIAIEKAHTTSVYCGRDETLLRVDM